MNLPLVLIRRSSPARCPGVPAPVEANDKPRGDDREAFSNSSIVEYGALLRNDQRKRHRGEERYRQKIAFGVIPNLAGKGSIDDNFRSLAKQEACDRQALRARPCWRQWRRSRRSDIRC